MKTLVARWETRGKKHWLELYYDDQGYTYREDNGGGNLGNISEDAAWNRMHELVRTYRMGNINLTLVTQ